MLRPRISVWLFLLLVPAALVALSGFHLIKKIPLGGEGGWDCLAFDPGSGRLYISRATHVIVLDAASGKVVGDIPDTAGVHGIALAPELGRGFTSNGRAGTVTIFDAKTLAIIGQANAGQNPDAIVYDSASKRVFAMNGRSGDATAIEAASGKVAGTVRLEGKPEFAVADGRGRIYVNLEDKSQLLALDSRKLKVVARWPLAPCEEPTGLAIDLEHRRLFAGCLNKLMAVVDADSGKVIATLPIGSGVDGTAFDSGLQHAYASNGEGTLTVIHEDASGKFTVVDNVPTQRGARTMALDPASHQIYVVSADFGPPPPPTPEQPRPRPMIVPNTFVVLVLGR
ncbi:MAG: PQQ-binding-like beta-propeller repeat protein [Terriglobales bacterium]